MRCVYTFLYIKNKRKLKWCLVNYDSGKIRQTLAASDLGITPRRFRQLYKEYKTTGQVPIIGVSIGRPKKEISDEWKDIILKEYEAFRLNALYMEKTIYARFKIRIPHNTGHTNEESLLCTMTVGQRY